MCAYGAENKSPCVQEIAIFPKPSYARLVQLDQFERNTPSLTSGLGTRQRLCLLRRNRVVQSDPDHLEEEEHQLNPSFCQFYHYRYC